MKNSLKPYFCNLVKGSKTDFLQFLDNRLAHGQKTFVITANPETFSFGLKDEKVNTMLNDPEVKIVADGIGIVKGADMLGTDGIEKIPGVEISEHLIKSAAENGKSVFFFGAKEEVLDALEKKIKKQYPSLKIAGRINGYVDDKDAVFEDIRRASPDVVLVALGIPVQEKLIYSHLSEFDKGIFVGVGGSFDVLSGTKKRAPEFFLKHNIEWLYRIIKEPSRLKRFYNSNVKFIFAVKKESKRTDK